MDTIVTGYPEVDLSITNPNVNQEDALIDGIRKQLVKR